MSYPQRSERLAVGLLDEKYTYHKSFWRWFVDKDGYLVVEKRRWIEESKA